MLSRIDFLRAERANVARLLEAAQEAARLESDGGGAARKRMGMLEEILARMDRLIAEWEAAATRMY
jgi:hypothetical protein